MAKMHLPKPRLHSSSVARRLTDRHTTDNSPRNTTVRLWWEKGLAEREVHRSNTDFQTKGSVVDKECRRQKGPHNRERLGSVSITGGLGVSRADVCGRSVRRPCLVRAIRLNEAFEEKLCFLKDPTFGLSR